MKRPWILTPRGQRTSLHLANVLSLALFISFALQYALVETPRTSVTNLDPKNVSYCELSECPKIQGLELTNGFTAQSNLKPQPFGMLLELDFTNHQMLQGDRELWLRIESPEGKLLEMARVQIKLDLKTRTTAQFLLTLPESQVLNARLSLGY